MKPKEAKSLLVALFIVSPSLLFFLLLRLFLLPLFSALKELAYAILESLPRISVQPLAQPSIIIHLAPAIPSPLATSHINHEITIRLLVVNDRIIALVATGAWWKTVDLALWDECEMRSDPGLIHVHIFECVLLLVFPLHVLLFVADGVPPHVEEAVGPN